MSLPSNPPSCDVSLIYVYVRLVLFQRTRVLFVLFQEICDLIFFLSFYSQLTYTTKRIINVCSVNLKEIMKAQLNFLFGIFAVFLILGICGYISYVFISALPASNAKTTITSIFNIGFGVIDKSFLILLIILMFVDLYASWKNPSEIQAIFNLFALLFLGFINLVLMDLVPALSFLSIQTFLPSFYSFVISPAKVFLIYAFLIFSIVFNVKRVDNNGI